MAYGFIFKCSKACNMYIFFTSMTLCDLAQYNAITYQWCRSGSCLIQVLLSTRKCHSTKEMATYNNILLPGLLWA